MNISFNGFGDNTVTFETEGTVRAGMPVKVVASGKVAPCENGDKICGVAVNVRDGFAAVQTGGYVTLESDGVIPAGFATIAATADGKAAVNENGREVLVVTSEDDTVGFIL